MSWLLWPLRALLNWADMAAFVQAFGDPRLALAAIVVICLPVIAVVAMFLWATIHVRRLKVEADRTLLLTTGRPVRRTIRLFGRKFWDYEKELIALPASEQQAMTIAVTPTPQTPADSKPPERRG